MEILTKPYDLPQVISIGSIKNYRNMCKFETKSVCVDIELLKTALKALDTFNVETIQINISQPDKPILIRPMTENLKINNIGDAGIIIAPFTIKAE